MSDEHPFRPQPCPSTDTTNVPSPTSSEGWPHGIPTAEDAEIERLTSEAKRLEDERNTWLSEARQYRERAETVEAEVERLREAAYNAEEFMVTVQTWMGGPDDKQEALDDLRATLRPDEEP